MLKTEANKFYVNCKTLSALFLVVVFILYLKLRDSTEKAKLRSRFSAKFM